MKALVYRGLKNVAVEDVPEPKPQSGELLLKTTCTGLCFSDKHAYDSGYMYRKGIVIGHEGCGEVAGIGPDVEGWKIGDYVGVVPTLYCGACLHCLAGLQHFCQTRIDARLGRAIGVDARRADGSLQHGFAADYLTVPETNCYRLPDGMSVVAASTIEVLGAAMHMARSVGVKPADNVVCLGLDDLNYDILQLLPWFTRRIVVDPIPRRQELARRLGVEAVLDPTQVDVVKEVRRLMPFGADVVFAASEDYIESSLKYSRQAIDIVRVKGTVSHFRFYLKSKAFEGVEMSYPKEIRLEQGGLQSHEPVLGGRARSNYQMAIDAVSSGKVDGTPYVTRVISLKDLKSKSDVDEMFALIPEKEVKITLVP